MKFIWRSRTCPFSDFSAHAGRRWWWGSPCAHKLHTCVLPTRRGLLFPFIGSVSHKTSTLQMAALFAVFIIWTSRLFIIGFGRIKNHFGSPKRVVQLWFWVRSDQSKRSVRNSRKSSAAERIFASRAVSPPICGRTLRLISLHLKDVL